MTCKVCREEIHENNHGGYYHVKGWVEFTADHKAKPAPKRPARGSRSAVVSSRHGP